MPDRRDGRGPRPTQQGGTVEPGPPRRAGWSARGARSLWLPVVLCLTLTFVASAIAGLTEYEAERARFDSAVVETRSRIQLRMASYVALLRGSAPLLAQFKPVTRQDFQVFVDGLRLSDHYPGTLGVGYSVCFGAVSVEEATARAHSEGWTDVQVWPATPRDEVHSIVLLEPRTPRNQAAIGYDMFTEPIRRRAMERARDTGEPALSGKVTLVQEIDAQKQPGFLLYLPVYADGPIPVSTEARRAALHGFVYAPLRAGDLLEGIFEHGRPSAAFDLHDGDEVSEATLLYALGRPIGPHEDVVAERLDVAGRVWTARFVRANGGAEFRLAFGVAALGVLLSGFVLAAVRARERARVRELSARASAVASQEMLRFAELFVGILGHDLRNPLNAITLTTGHLARRCPPEGETSQALTRIQASCNRMARMIDQVLDLTRARLGGGIQVVVGPVDLGALAGDVVDELRKGRPDCPIELETSGDLRGRWDADRLAQVFSNLIGNAADHRRGGPVKVEVRGEDPGRVVATVHNQGAIAPSLMPVVFEPFHRDVSREGRVSPGLGLGLFIARALVEAHRGTIEVASTEAQGTTFTLALPR